MILTSRWHQFAIDGPSAPVGELAHLAWPHLEPVEDAITRPRWMIKLGESSYDLAPDTVSPPHSLELDLASRTLNLDGPKPWLHVIALRYIRAIERARAVSLGALPLHGACVVYRGRAIAFVGHHRAGKTTAAMSAARLLGAMVLSNDDILLIPGDSWKATGLPRSVGIRRDSVGAYEPALDLQSLAGLVKLHPRADPEKLFVAQCELSNFGVPFSKDAFPLSAIVELTVDDTIGWRRAEAAVPVADAWIDVEPDRFLPEFVANLGVPAVHDRARKITELVQAVPVYRYGHPPRRWVYDLLSRLESAG